MDGTDAAAKTYNQITIFELANKSPHPTLPTKTYRNNRIHL
jgi:hypothetical protein